MTLWWPKPSSVCHLVTTCWCCYGQLCMSCSTFWDSWPKPLAFFMWDRSFSERKAVWHSQDVWIQTLWMVDRCEVGDKRAPFGSGPSPPHRRCRRPHRDARWPGPEARGHRARCTERAWPPAGGYQEGGKMTGFPFFGRCHNGFRPNTQAITHGNSSGTCSDEKREVESLESFSPWAFTPLPHHPSRTSPDQAEGHLTLSRLLDTWLVSCHKHRHTTPPMLDWARLGQASHNDMTWVLCYRFTSTWTRNIQFRNNINGYGIDLWHDVKGVAWCGITRSLNTIQIHRSSKQVDKLCSADSEVHRQGHMRAGHSVER